MDSKRGQDVKPNCLSQVLISLTQFLADRQQDPEHSLSNKIKKMKEEVRN